MSSWIMTFTGKRFRPFDPDPAEIDIRDIAHALSHTCRYGGHTRRFYSVAEHCVLLSRIVPADMAFDALMHDAAEAYLGDIPRPIKKAREMNAWRDAEWIVERAIATRFGVRLPMSPALADYDSRMIVDEWPQLMPDPEGDDIGVSGAPLGIRVECWPPYLARRRFLEAFCQLSEGRAQ
jgi:Predicted hydrolases of HD superfamily